MINAICKDGILKGKFIAQPNHVYEFKVQSGSNIYEYVRFTMPDYFRGDLIAWRIKHN